MREVLDLKLPRIDAGQRPPNMADHTNGGSISVSYGEGIIRQPIRELKHHLSELSPIYEVRTIFKVAVEQLLPTAT
jgi:hypothetical protein